MEKDESISFDVTIPDGVTVTITGNTITVQGPKGTLERELWHPGVHILVEHKDGGAEQVVVTSDTARKKLRAVAGTYVSHIKNMITGVTEGFFYKLAVVHAHFPMQIALTKEGNAVAISNFLGERKPRMAKIASGATVELRGKEILVSGMNKEAVGQTAANIEQTTKIRGYDPRVFQDGIYLLEKGVGMGT
ncbi:MAG: 50S ribosomal protein L6 [Candidatus Methanospirareceae archaeon]